MARTHARITASASASCGERNCDHDHDPPHNHHHQEDLGQHHQVEEEPLGAPSRGPRVQISLLPSSFARPEVDHSYHHDDENKNISYANK